MYTFLHQCNFPAANSLISLYHPNPLLVSQRDIWPLSLTIMIMVVVIVVSAVNYKHCALWQALWYELSSQHLSLNMIPRLFFIFLMSHR